MNTFWLKQRQTDVPEENSWLGAAERLHLQGMPFAKRRTDWRLGRWTAKAAVAAYLGQPAEAQLYAGIEIRQGPSGVPEVFLSGQPGEITISLSHSSGTAMCALAGRGAHLGCDLERIEPHSKVFIADYFTRGEHAFLASAPAADRVALVVLLWSAKESALKALGQGLRLDTRSVIVSPADSEQISVCNKKRMPVLPRVPSECRSNGWHGLRVYYAEENRTFRGWWRRAGDLVQTLVTDPPALAPILLSPLSPITKDAA